MKKLIAFRQNSKKNFTINDEKMIHKIKPYLNRFRLTTYNDSKNKPVSRVMFGEKDRLNILNRNNLSELNDSKEKIINIEDGVRISEESVPIKTEHLVRGGEEVTPLKQRPSNFSTTEDNVYKDQVINSQYPRSFSRTKTKLIAGYNKHKGKVFMKFQRRTGTASGNETDSSYENAMQASNASGSIINCNKSMGSFNPYVKKRDEKSSKRGSTLNKLQPIKAYSRDGNNVKSVKRSAGNNPDREINSPYVDLRENKDDENSNKIRQIRVLKNADTELTKIEGNAESNISISNNPLKQNGAYFGYRSGKQGSIVNQLNQQRWKSTLHGRALESENVYQEKSSLKQMADSQQKGKINKPAIVPDRSRSFQPSVIRRREGGQLKNIDIESEMVRNIKNRRDQEKN